MLGRLPDAQEPGRRRRIAVYPTSGRVPPPPPWSAGSPRPVSRWRRLPLPLSLTRGPRGNGTVSRAPVPFRTMGHGWTDVLARAPAFGWAGFRPSGPPEPKTFFSFSFSAFFSFSCLYLNILCTKNYQNTF
jgi:hypothetical protein